MCVGLCLVFDHIILLFVYCRCFIALCELTLHFFDLSFKQFLVLFVLSSQCDPLCDVLVSNLQVLQSLVVLLLCQRPCFLREFCKAFALFFL